MEISIQPCMMLQWPIPLCAMLVTKRTSLASDTDVKNAIRTSFAKTVSGAAKFLGRITMIMKPGSTAASYVP